MVLKFIVGSMIKPGVRSSWFLKRSPSLTFNLIQGSTKTPPAIQGGTHMVRRMFSLQQSLPRFPVPPLQQTLDKFLETVKPLYDEETYRNAEKLVTEFGKSSGPQLQSLLEQKASQEVNWLSDWWLHVAYLDYRSPSAIHVNPGITIPHQNFSGQDQQAKFAAKWVSGVLDYKVMIDEQTLPVEYMGKNPLCMKQFFMILSACRIPGKKRDKFVVFPPDQPNAPRHIVVMHNNHIFSVDVYGSDGNPLSVDQIERQLQAVLSQSQDTGPPLGIMTSEGRNTWGKTYDRLSKDEHNKKLFEEIQRSIFVLCLDKPIPHSSPENRTTVITNQMNHGGGTQYNSCNRWFDKTMQFIIGSDGAAGLNYEHSSAEGPPIVSTINHIMTYLKKGDFSRPDAPGVNPPRKLRFNLDSQIDDEFNSAMHSLDATIADLDMVSLVFKGFGKNFVKTHKLSPDAFIQVAFQLAYHRLHHKNAPTYESGSLRMFQHGRTETIRSCTQASDRYCRAMLDSSTSDSERARLLREAIDAHRKYTNDAITGNGVDRHLLGLKLIAIENNFNIPDFLMDPVYTESCHWRLSTSQVASPHDALLCFAPVVPDGYGICYNPMPDHLNFAVSAWKVCAETDAQTLANSLSQSLNDGRDVLMKTQSAKL